MEPDWGRIWRTSTDVLPPSAARSVGLNAPAGTSISRRPSLLVKWLGAETLSGKDAGAIETVGFFMNGVGVPGVGFASGAGSGGR